MSEEEEQPITTTTTHRLSGHHLAYLVTAGNSVLHSELVPARHLLQFHNDSIYVPQGTIYVEASIILYGVGGIHIAMFRTTLHPQVLATTLNTLTWRILADYLEYVIGATPHPSPST